MLARLWWKDARQFWPIWVFIALAAAAGQWAALRYFPREVRTGFLGAMGLGWACLYGCAVAAAAFAGEREAGTLRLLDTLPVDRVRLWVGKAAFALVTTAALGAVLFGLAASGTTRWDTAMWGSLAGAVFGGATVLLEAVGWGLFWSSASGTALTAAVLTVVSVGVSPLFRRFFEPEPLDLAGGAASRLVVAVLTATVSGLIMIRSGPGGRPSRRRSLRSPRSEQVAIKPEAGRDEARAVGRVWPFAVRSLAWETVREGFPVWWRLAAIGLGVPLGLAWFIGWSAAPFGIILCLLAGLVGGVNAFGAENRGRTHRFLAHHGVRPGTVWAVKVAVWGAGLGLLWLPWLVVAATGVLRGAVGPGSGMVFFVTGLMHAVAAGLLCGMTIRRGLTAGVVAVVVTLGLAVPQGALFELSMMPVELLPLVPLTLVAVSWAWSADWMLDRPGAARWVRLAAWLAIASGAVFSCYAGVRAWSLPDLGPVSFAGAPAGFGVRDVAGGGNAADVYREAARKLKPLGASPRVVIASGPFPSIPLPPSDPPPVVAPGLKAKAEPELTSIGEAPAQITRVIESGWDPKADAAVARLHDNPGALALVRRASAMPWCDFGPTITPPELANVRELARLVALSSRERQARGDLDGEWDDLMVMFRMARDLSGPVPLAEVRLGLEIERQALGLAMQWAADRRQTPQRLGRAMAAYRGRPGLRPMTDTIRAEAALAEQTLSAPREALLALVGGVSRGARDGRAQDHLLAELLTSPWEVARARRAARLLFASKVWLAASEPRARPWPVKGGWTDFVSLDSRYVAAGELVRAFESTPLARIVFPNLDPLMDDNDRNEVARRAVVYVLALRDWQIRHGGRLPEALSDLDLSQSGGVPNDPYSGLTFGYVRAGRRLLLPLGHFDPITPESNEALSPVPGGRLLYSVGPDRRDNFATINDRVDPKAGHLGDIIFPLPAPEDVNQLP